MSKQTEKPSTIFPKDRAMTAREIIDAVLTEVGALGAGDRPTHTKRIEHVGRISGMLLALRNRLPPEPWIDAVSPEIEDAHKVAHTDDNAGGAKHASDGHEVWQLVDVSIRDAGHGPKGTRYAEIGWASREHGTGVITLVSEPDGGVTDIEAETLPKEFVKRVLNKLVDDAELTD